MSVQPQHDLEKQCKTCRGFGQLPCSCDVVMHKVNGTMCEICTNLGHTPCHVCDGRGYNPNKEVMSDA